METIDDYDFNPQQDPHLFLSGWSGRLDSNSQTELKFRLENGLEIVDEAGIMYPVSVLNTYVEIINPMVYGDDVRDDAIKLSGHQNGLKLFFRLRKTSKLYHLDKAFFTQKDELVKSTSRMINDVIFLEPN